ANLRSVGERLGIPLGGAATFDGTARGPLTAVAVEASTDVQAPAYGPVNAGHARARVQATGLGGTRPSGTVRIAVTEAQVRAYLQIAGLDIAPLCAAASDHTCGGTVSVAARIAGKAEAARLTADVRSDALRAAAVDLGTLVVDARYEERQTTLHARLQHPDAGEVRADGTVPFDLAWAGPRRDTSEEPLALRARADRGDLRIAHALAPGLGGTVRVGGPAGAPGVRADLEVDRAIVRPAALPTQDGAAKPDPSIVVISDGEPRAASAELPSVARAVELGVTVRIERNAWVRRTDADIELGGDLKITKAPD